MQSNTPTVTLCDVSPVIGYLSGAGVAHAALCFRMIETNFRDVDLRIVGYHTLVHAIEGEQFAVRAPEGTLADAELIAVNTTDHKRFRGCHPLKSGNRAISSLCQALLVTSKVRT